MKNFIFLFLIFLLTACGNAGTPPTGEGLIASRIRKIRDLRVECNWPGFTLPQFDTPLLYYTDSICYAVAPTHRFREIFGIQSTIRDKEIEIFKTALPDSLPFHMETQITFGDSTYQDNSPFLHCSSPEITAQFINGVASDDAWALMALHEYMHGFQYKHAEFAEAFGRHVSDIPQRTFRTLYRGYDWLRLEANAENDALLTALSAKNAFVRDSCIRSFFSIRERRKSRMAEDFGDQMALAETYYETMEGTARYIEAKAGFRLGLYTEKDDWLWNTGSTYYFYATGYNLVRLLDKLGGDKSRLFNEPTLSLAQLLAETINTSQQ